MKTRLLATAILSATILSSAGAAAQNSQPWLEDRRGKGEGVRTGDVTLHPGVAAQFGYDSNYFQRSDNTTPGDGIFDEPVEDALRLRITPSLSLQTTGEKAGPGGAGVPPKATFNANVSASYNELFPLNSDTPDDVRKQRHVSARAGFRLNILPRRVWGGDILADYIRAIEPSNDPALRNSWDRDTLRYGAGVNWRPGGGLFEWRLGYEGRTTFFERAAFQNFNNIQHIIQTRGRWRFLPRTAVLFDAEYGFVRFTRNNTIQNDSNPVKARLGLKGLVTKHFAFLALGGWAVGFHDRQGPEFDSWLAHGELKWFLQPQPDLQSGTAPVGLSSVALGFTRDYSNSYLANFFIRNRVYANVDYFIAQRILFQLGGGYSRVHHPASVERAMPPVDEDRIDALAFIEYRVTSQVGINLTGRYDASLGEKLVQPGPGAAVVDDITFERYQIYLGARWFL